MSRLNNFKNKPAYNAMRNISGRKICILGLGIENYALVKFLLSKKINSEITVCDARGKKELGERYSVIASASNEALPAGRQESRKKETTGLPRRRSSPPRNDNAVNWKLGKNYDKGLNKYDIIFRSPGYPLHRKNIQKLFTEKGLPRRSAPRNDIMVSSPMKLFFDLCPTKNIIGVTGTKGKGTTSALIHKILKSAGKHVWLGGNIGVAPFEFIDKIKKNDWVILELSSFQLEDMEVSPKIAVITNLYKEHLSSADPNNPNYHLSLKGYRDAKMNIVKYQKRGDKAIVNRKLKVPAFAKASAGKKNSKSKIIYFDKSDLESKLAGKHNKENIAAAVEVAKIVGIKRGVIEKVIKNFKGLEHRLELVKSVNGVKYYNDSFATTPESTITALNSFEEPIILIAGGAEKKSDFKKLARVIKKRVMCVVLLKGKATPRLKKEIVKAGFFGKNIKLVYNIREAVKIARENSIKGEIVLLSPACASFGMFKDYKERGWLFKKEVDRLA